MTSGLDVSSQPLKTMGTGFPPFFPEIEPARLKYTESDRIRAFRTQPLDYITPSLIPQPPEKRSIRPPLMHLGWIIDDDEIYDYAARHDIAPTIHDGNEVRRNYYAAARDAITPMCEEAGIEDDDRIQVVLVSDGSFKLGPEDQRYTHFHMALTVGTNYTGCISQEDADKLGQIAAGGARLRWYLDYEKWKWMSNPKPSGRTQPKKKRN